MCRPPEPAIALTGVADSDDMPGVLETLEVRWFADGSIPLSVTRWFEDTAPRFDVERRVDSYLLTGRSDLGVKRRDHGPIEVKERHRVGSSIWFGGRLTAQVEEWHKRVDERYSTAPGRWVDIDKTVTTYRYRAQGAAGTACDVELAAVEVDGTAAWTLALEASGPRPARRAALRLASEEFFGDTSLPSEISAALEFEAGYPAWLVEVVGE